MLRGNQPVAFVFDVCGSKADCILWRRASGLSVGLAIFVCGEVVKRVGAGGAGGFSFVEVCGMSLPF